MPFFIFGIQKVLYSRIRENYDGSGSLKCEGIISASGKLGQ